MCLLLEIVLGGCLFGLSDSFQSLEARSPNKHLEAVASFVGLEAHERLSITKSSQLRKHASHSLLQNYILRHRKVNTLKRFVSFIYSLATITLGYRDSHTKLHTAF
jgi:hypothetical protein